MATTTRNRIRWNRIITSGYIQRHQKFLQMRPSCRFKRCGGLRIASGKYSWWVGRRVRRATRKHASRSIWTSHIKEIQRFGTMDYSKAFFTYCAKDILHFAWSSKFIIIIIIKMTLRFQGHPSTHALYTRETSSERLPMSLISTASGRSCPKDVRRAG